MFSNLTKFFHRLLDEYYVRKWCVTKEVPKCTVLVWHCDKVTNVNTGKNLGTPDQSPIFFYFFCISNHRYVTLHKKQWMKKDLNAINSLKILNCLVSLIFVSHYDIDVVGSSGHFSMSLQHYVTSILTDENYPNQQIYRFIRLKIFCSTTNLWSNHVKNQKHQ